ncbi:MFS general substrate transporter [Russula vinacea]|nr:MFS general substrate transporter [Russula vinacea]
MTFTFFFPPRRSLPPTSHSTIVIEMGPFNETSDEKRGHVSIDSKQLDTGAHLDASLQSQLDPGESLRIRSGPTYPTSHVHIQFMDKATLGSASILGILKAAHLTANQLGTTFYLGYLAFEIPQNLALQSLNIFIWGIALCCHAACKNFAGLFAVRFVLGICEGSITAGFMIPWQWLMIITGTLTLITAASFFFLFPDSPINAWFLTEDERAKAVRRIKDNQTGVENKHFKKEQMIEALTDPKTWLFALFAVFDNIPNSIVNQLQIIFVSFGFNPLQTTLLSCVSGVAEIVVIFTGVTIASRVPNSIAWVGIASFIPSLLGLFLVNFLPWHDKVGLLFSVWMQVSGVICAVLSFTWVSQTTAGHTKRVTTNAIMLSAYCIGNAAGPLMWKAKYKPRILLARENKRRDAEQPDDSFDDVHVVKIDEDGKRTEVKVSKEFLDLTDRQNRDFRYVL